MKALLIIPPTGRYMRSDRCQAPVDTRVAEPARAPIDLAYTAAVLEQAGVECRIKDYPMAQQGWVDVRDDLREFSPGLVLISTTTPTIENDLIACAMAKEINPEIITAAKGAHFLIFDKEILGKFKNLDVVIRGEPENTVKELALSSDYSEIRGITFRKDSNIIRNPDAAFWEELDSLPFPARHLLDNELYRTPDTDEPIAFINTSRGCPNRCVFCAAGLVSGYKVRKRSVKSATAEIEECVKKYKIRNFFFAADTFTLDKAWVIDFCRQIIERNLQIRWGANSRVDMIDEDRISWMKRAGCYVIGFGAESASQFMLDKMGKGITAGQIEKAANLCKKGKVESFLNLVIGLPWETRETVEETVKFVKKTSASFIEVNIVYPIPGTEFYNIAKDKGLFSESDLFGHDHTRPLVKSFSLSTSELMALRKRILFSFYMRPAYIAGRVCKLNSTKVAMNYFKYGIRLVNNLLKT